MCFASAGLLSLPLIAGCSASQIGASLARAMVVKVVLHMLLIGMDLMCGPCCKACAALLIFLDLCLCCGTVVFMHMSVLPRAVPMLRLQAFPSVTKSQCLLMWCRAEHGASKYLKSEYRMPKKLDESSFSRNLSSLKGKLTASSGKKFSSAAAAAQRAQ
jgi:hypothetical protein